MDPHQHRAFLSKHYNRKGDVCDLLYSLHLCNQVKRYKPTLAGALFMDLSKAFDNVDHNLLLAKLNAYGINLDALQLIRSYLFKRHQRVKVNSTFSDWKEIRFGVPQGSVLGPLLFIHS